MTPDTIVFDIETSNFFTDPDVGWDNFGALKVSVVGAYSYERDAYQLFTEHEMKELAERFRNAGRIVGFGINRYDVPVLTHHFQRLAECRDIDLWQKERIDLLAEIEAATGERISLSKLAQANLGKSKDRHGSEAITLYKEGKLDELKAYCLQDVEFTKELYERWRDGRLVVPEKRTGELVLVSAAKASDGNKTISRGGLF